MTVSWSSSTYNEFTLEAARIEEMVWAALAIEPSFEILLCGYENSLPIIDRALGLGARVSVIDTQPESLRAAAARGIETIRASTTNIPIRNDRYSVVIAYHYLHEVDPTYHTQIMSELGRVARRIAIVEPGPPADLLGSRIASLYSRAKRRLGQFEQYQNLEYWRRLLLGIRSHVSPSEIRYAHLPPKEFLHDTMQILIDSIKIAGAPEDDLRSLRGLAAASDAQLVPQPRYVLLGGITSADIPDRLRLAELNKLAPTRYQASPFNRRHLESTQLSPTLAPGTYAPDISGKTKTIKKRLGSWFNTVPAHQPLPLALPAFNQQLPALPAYDEEAAQAKSAFGAEVAANFGRSAQPTSDSLQDPISALFNMPQIPGSDSMEWSDDTERTNFGF